MIVEKIQKKKTTEAADSAKMSSKRWRFGRQRDTMESKEELEMSRERDFDSIGPRTYFPGI